jgi:hypothetical protein
MMGRKYCQPAGVAAMDFFGHSYLMPSACLEPCRRCESVNLR